MTRIDKFLFDAGDPIICSAMRIAYAVLLLVYVVQWMFEAHIWFVDSGVLKSETMQLLGNNEYGSLLFYLPSTSSAVLSCLSLLLVHGVLLLVGCGSRIQAVCIFVWLTSFQHRNMLICDGQDVLFRWLIFCMIFMPLDYAWSLGGKRGAASSKTLATAFIKPSAWALRLVQFQITAVYLSTAWSKWQGQTWRDGTAVYYVSRMDDLFGRFWLPSSLFETPWIAGVVTWGVVGLEALLPLLLWFRPTRRLALVAAVCLHLSIEYAMHLYLFEWIMLVGLMAFVRPEEWSFLPRLIGRRTQAVNRGRTSEPMAMKRGVSHG